MERDPRVENASKAIVKLARECVEGGVTPVAMGYEIARALADFVDGYRNAPDAAALLREYAASLGKRTRADRPEAERELLELADRGLDFIRTLQVAGIDESTAVTALNNACVLTVARGRGAAAAAAWLRRIADHTESNARAIELTAQAA